MLINKFCLVKWTITISVFVTVSSSTHWDALWGSEIMTIVHSQFATDEPPLADHVQSQQGWVQEKGAGGRGAEADHWAALLISHANAAFLRWNWWVKLGATSWGREWHSISVFSVTYCNAARPSPVALVKEGRLGLNIADFSRAICQ